MYPPVRQLRSLRLAAEVAPEREAETATAPTRAGHDCEKRRRAERAELRARRAV